MYIVASEGCSGQGMNAVLGAGSRGDSRRGKKGVADRTMKEGHQQRKEEVSIRPASRMAKDCSWLLGGGGHLGEGGGVA